MSTLHLVMTPDGLTACLLRATPGDAILLIEDGVRSVLPQRMDDGDGPSFYRLESHRERRAHQLPDAVLPIDMMGFVRLTESHAALVRWY